MRKCGMHPTYAGLARPKVLCEQCWQIWFGMSKTCVNCGCQQVAIENEGDDD